MNYKGFLKLLEFVTQQDVVLWKLSRRRNPLIVEGMTRLYIFELKIGDYCIILAPSWKMNSEGLKDEDQVVFSIEVWDDNDYHCGDYNALTSDPNSFPNGAQEPSPLDLFTLYLVVRREWMYRNDMDRYFEEYTKDRTMTGDTRDYVPKGWNINGKIHVSYPGMVLH